MMNNWQKNFIYLSQIMHIPVIDLVTGRRIGWSSDIVAGLREMYPRVIGLVIRQAPVGKRAFIPWKNIKKMVDNKAIYVEFAAGTGPDELKLADNEILLKETFWDKQIVDISGSKVVRVNDLHLLREEPNLWVVHMDIGFKGLIRRLGWSVPVEFMVRWLFSYELKEKLISWKFVQPITTDKGAGQLSLKAPGSRLSDLHPADLADILGDLGTDERVVILEALDNVTAAHTLMELPLNLRIQTAELLSQEQLVRLLRDMPTDEVVDLVVNFPRKKLSAVLAHLPTEKTHQIKTLMTLSERVAGSIMNTEYVAVKYAVTAAQVIEKIKTEPKKESIYYIYITDDNDMLVGAVTLRQLLIAPPEKPLVEIMRKRLVKVRVDADIKKVARVFFKYDFTVVPVVDRHNKMQGIITIKDAFEAEFPEIREESEEQK